MRAPVLSSNALIVSFPFTKTRGFFRLQQINGGGNGSCAFQATPAVINPGESSSLTWCPVAGTTYRISPGAGIVTSGNLAVSPTNTTVYSLIASNAQGFSTNNAAVIVGPCGWLQVSNWDVIFSFGYYVTPSTSSYDFHIFHIAGTTFHLIREPSSTDTDAYYFGFAGDDTNPDGLNVDDEAEIDDVEVDKTGPQTFTTTEKSGRAQPDHTVSYLSLHLTCTTYDFNYNVVTTATETSQFGTDTSLDGVGTGAIAGRPLPATNVIASYNVEIPAQYPPMSAEFFTPSSSLGKALFNTGTAASTTANTAGMAWQFTPAP